MGKIKKLGISALAACVVAFSAISLASAPLASARVPSFNLRILVDACETNPNFELAHCFWATMDAVAKFESTFDIHFNIYWYGAQWDTSDVSDRDSAVEMIQDLGGDFSFWNGTNEIVIGWTYDTDRQGMAYVNDSFCLCSVHPTRWWWPDWSDDAVAMHEISHCLGCPDHWGWSSCIMNYFHAWFLGTEAGWCHNCAEKIKNTIEQKV